MNAVREVGSERTKTREAQRSVVLEFRDDLAAAVKLYRQFGQLKGCPEETRPAVS